MQTLMFVGGVAGMVGVIVLINELVARETRQPPRRRAPLLLPPPMPSRQCIHCGAPLPEHYPPAWTGCVACMGARTAAAWQQQRAARLAGAGPVADEAQLITLLRDVPGVWDVF